MAPGGAASEIGAPPTVPLSFSNNFWGRDDAGVDPLLTRMQNAKTTCDELKAFYKARAELEEDYARKLFAICRKPLGSTETGTLRASLDVARGETEAMGKQHASIAQQMKSELDEPLTAFAGGMKERKKIVQSGIERLLKTKQAQTAHVNKSRDKYEQDCLRIKGYLAQGHMVMGQEERKNKAKLEKTQINMASNSQEYEAAVKVLEETTGRWNKEWKSACDKFQDLEEERLDFTKSSLWAFANIASTVCVSDDASCEKIRLTLEKCEVEKDITNFIKTCGTGQEIPDAPRYINFCREDVDSASEVSEDDNYSVAQFSRTGNPAFRTSSPGHAFDDAEERYTSRHASQEPEPLNEMTSRTANSSRPHQLNCRPSESNVPPDYDLGVHGIVEHVPHNEYPSDGMTMFCRNDLPSMTSSAVSSNTRPPSRASQSDAYSNPSSFTSAEPISGKSSPTKNVPVNGVGLPGMTSQSAEKAVAKKRSGFFSNSPFNSPFRRKSKKEPNHERSQSQSGWNAASTKPDFASSYGAGPSTQFNVDKSAVQQSPFNRNAGRMAPEGEEPADPRASFQLSIGQNILDVSNPDDSNQSTPRATMVSRNRGNGAAPIAIDEHDPVAKALADLKLSSNGSNLAINKQASTRQPVDNYHRVKTPAPGQHPAARPGIDQDILSGQRGTPPPAYEGFHRRADSALGVPQPAFTSKEMRSRTEQWGNGTSVSAPIHRPGSSVGGRRPVSRNGARSPGPGQSSVIPRAVSPQTQVSRNGARSPGPEAPRQAAPPNAYNRAVSPNPFSGRPRGSTQSGNSPRQGLGAATDMQLARYESGDGRYPHSSTQSHGPGAIPAGSGRGRQNASMASNNPRAQSAYGAEGLNTSMGAGSWSARGRPPGGMDVELRRERSKSIHAGAGGFGKEMFVPPGRTGPLHYARAMYSYTAAIPEELSFNKGDILAVLRMQDDGWWEAEVSRSAKGGAVGTEGVGLVPSNYLQRC